MPRLSARALNASQLPDFDSHLRCLALTGLFLLGAAAGGPPIARADVPAITSWELNTTGATGYNGLPANVQRVRYSSANVYIDCSSIPDYSIGPWPMNPNVPQNKAFTLRFPRSPVENTGTKTSTPLGPIGSWNNGVAIFNALDARSYNNQNIWHQDAILVESPSFDACLGHPAPNGTYHNHQNARCLWSGVAHSPLLGYAFDGFPVYGPYAYTNADGTGDITRMRTSYRKRSITQRTTLPDGTVLTPAQYGPAVSAQYPLGYYVEDYEFVTGLGDLDVYNGRIAVMPEYPLGTYAYYVTIDDTGASLYPYSIGSKYYGVVATDDISTMGHVTISEAVVDYTHNVGVDASPGGGARIALAQNRPNPAKAAAVIGFMLPAASHVSLTVFDLRGRVVLTLLDGMRPAGAQFVTVDPQRLEAGVYFYQLRAGVQAETRRMLIVH